MKKNEILEANIIDTTSEGYGIAKIDGLTVFVKGAIDGETVRLRVLKVKKNLAFAKVEEIVKPSIYRIEPDCYVNNKCGGCIFRHVDYQKQLEIKQNHVENCIRRIGGLTDVKIDNILPSENIYNYRNKAQLPIRKNKSGEIEIGFFRKGTHEVVDTQECKLHPKEFTLIINTVKQWIYDNGVSVYDEATHKGLLRHLYIRKAFATGELMVCLVVNGSSLPHTKSLLDNLLKLEINIKSVMLNSNTEKTNVILGKKYVKLYGEDSITDELCSLKFNLSAESFYQVNSRQAEKLYGIAKTFANLKKQDTLLDLYCGTGTIGLTMAKDVKEVIGVEIVQNAIEDAKINAKANGIGNARYICADSDTATQRFKTEGIKPDVVILDPPRKGCSQNAVNNVVELQPSRVVYISCDPATLARDLKLFAENGYEVKRVQPVDMFPWTGHVETVCLMSKVR